MVKIGTINSTWMDQVPTCYLWLNATLISINMLNKILRYYINIKTTLQHTQMDCSKVHRILLKKHHNKVHNSEHKETSTPSAYVFDTPVTLQVLLYLSEGVLFNDSFL